MSRRHWEEEVAMLRQVPQQELLLAHAAEEQRKAWVSRPAQMSYMVLPFGH